VLTPGPVCTAVHRAGEPSATPKAPVTTSQRAVVGGSVAVGTNPSPTAASFESSAMTNDVGLHSGGIGPHGAGGGTVAGGGTGTALGGVEPALAELLAPLEAKPEADAFDSADGWFGESEEE